MSELVTPTAPGPRRQPFTRSRAFFWGLAAFGLLVNALLVSLAVALASGPRTVEPPADRRIAVPFERDSPLWEPFRRWVVQEDGRNKPFDTFCRESVRALTGREHFEETRSMATGHVLSPAHDPVAVVTSWLMLAGDKSAPAAAYSNCDWEHYPF